MARRTPSKPGSSAPAAADIPTNLLEPAPALLDEQDRWVAVHAGAGTTIAEQAHDVELRESVFTDVDLSGCDLSRLQARDVRFQSCDLSGTILDSASLQRVEFLGCRMTGIMITNATVRDVLARECRADLINWRMTSASTLLAISTSMREADFYQARLTRCALLACDLRQATFRDCRLSDVDLHESQLEDLRDAGGLNGADIGADQVIPLALSLLAAQGIGVTDSPRVGDGWMPGLTGE